MGNKALLLLVGPTASGKTDLAVQLANLMNAEIISADSRQIYKHLNIGTGKPTSRQCRMVKHHLVSCVEPTITVTAEKYSLLASAALRQIQMKGKTCIVVGGTGLWIRSFIDGLAPVPPADPILRDQLRQKADIKGNLSLYQELEKIDPETTKKLHPSDRLRLIRALEIFILTGKKPSDCRKLKPIHPGLPACWFGIARPREELYIAAEKRIDDWLSQGWLEEVKHLLGQGISEQVPAMQAIGYSHLAKHLSGVYSFKQAYDLIKRDTRRYIKRQLTWFRAESRITWLDASLPLEINLEIIREQMDKLVD